MMLKLWNRIFKKEYQSIIPDENRFFLKSAFWTCFAILMFSFGVPFTISGLEDFRFLLGPLGQFRSIGRFAWVFFYGFNIIAFYAIYFQVRQIRKRVWQLLVFASLLIILFAEAYSFNVNQVKLNLWPNPAIREHFQKSDNTWLDSIQVEDYQGILTVPFFHVGSENIWFGPKSKEMHRSMWLAVQTGLPINSSFMGRTSVNQVINQLELIAEPYRLPQILDDLPNDKDFLIFLYKKSYKLKKDKYEALLQNLEPLHEDDQIKVFSISLDELKKRIDAKAKQTKNNYQNTRLFDFGNLKSTDSLRNFIHQNFDDQLSEKIYQGAGAFERKGENENILFDGHLPFQQTENKYVCSLWAFISGDLNPKIWIALEEYQAGTNDVINKKAQELYKDFRSFDKGWMLSEFSFSMKRPDSRIRIKVWNKDLEDRPLFLDELQIRPQNSQLYLESGAGFNNRWY